MLRNHRCGTLSDSLRYGIASNCLKTTKLYECKNRDMVRKLYKNIRSYKKVENLHRFIEHKDSTWELKSTHEGKPRGGEVSEMYKKSSEEDNTSKLKYVHLIPHESCPGNFIVLEIQPWEIDESKSKYSRVISTLQVPEILNAKTSVLWKIYNERRKLKVFSQELERLSHVCESRYERY